MSERPGFAERPQILDLSGISADAFPDRSKISVYPPFGYAPMKTSPSIRPRVLVRELPPIPADYQRASRYAEVAFWISVVLFVTALARATVLSLSLAAGGLVLYIATVKVMRRFVRSGRIIGPVETRSGPASPLAGVQATRFDRLQYAIVKVPMQNLRAFKFAVVLLPWTVLRLALHYARHRGFRSPMTDEDCWNLVVNTACLVPAVLSEDGSMLDLESPEDLPLETPQGQSFAGVKIRFDVATHRLVHCHFQGEDVSDDKETVAGIIHTLLIAWCHTKSHLASEAATLQIRRAEAKAVAPCSAFTSSLHEYLVFSDKGPIQTDTQAGVKGRTIYQATAIPMPHALDARKVQFRYYELLFKSRLIVRRLVHKHSVPVSGELLFNTCVVHSLDHLNCWEWQKGKLWSLDLSKSFRSRVVCVWFSDFYTRPMVNPFYSEYLKDAGPGFYRELYEELFALDKKLANSLLLSTSY